MFALLITLASIVLVAALSLASVLYMSNTHARVQALAKASTVLSQAEQLAGSARVFRQYEQAWPADVPALVSKQYLTSIPGYNAVTWRSLGPAATVYLLSAAVDQESCQAFNRKVRGSSGIYAQAVASFQVQCFGSSAPYSVLVKIEDSASLAADLSAALPGATLVAAEADATLSVSP